MQNFFVCFFDMETPVKNVNPCKQTEKNTRKNVVWKKHGKLL